MTLLVQNLTKTFGDRVAVDDVSLEIAGGETYGLLGPNGAGKTTTISMICGLLNADRGSVHVAGEAVTTHSIQARGRIGYVPQEIAVYPDLSARENLQFFGKLQGLRGDMLTRRMSEVLDVLGLTDRADDRTEQFSGGMQRRLNIGLGLLHEPELLVLDEPTVGVDPQSRNAILDSIETLSGQGIALLYTTHYMEEAERLCDRVGIMDEGQLIASGTRRQLVSEIDGHDRVRFEFADVPATDAIENLEGVRSVAFDGRFGDVDLDDAAHHLPRLLEGITAAGGVIRSVEVIEPDLEAVFLHLTGKALRDQ